MKKIINLMFYAILLLLVLNLSVFASDEDKLSKPIQVFKLPSGQTVIIKEVHTNPIVAINTWIRTGSINENDENNGVSHFLEHLLFKGTKNHPAGEIDKILETTGAEYNASTSKDYTNFYVTLASKYFDLALPLHADLILNAAIPPEELVKERKVVVEEIRRSEDTPQREVFFNLNELLFKNHPYKYDTIGTSKIIENIPREKILDYYHKWYIPSNMITIVVGDVDTEHVLDMIKKNFVSEYNHTVPLPVYETEPELTSPAHKLDSGDYKQTYFDLGFRAPSMKQLNDTYALDVASLILGGGRSSRLYKRLKQDQNLVNSLSVSNYTLKDDGIFLFDYELQPDNIDKVKQITLEEIEKIKNAPVTQEELQRTKNQVSRTFIYQNESVSNIASSIGYYATLAKLEDYLTYVEKINAVTAEDVQNAANKYLNINQMATSILEPENKEKVTKLSKISGVQKASNSQDNSKQASTNNEAVSKYILPNGMTLLLKTNPVNDVVSVNVFVRGGKLIENKAGLAGLVSNMLVKGTSSRSAEEIARETENLGIGLSPSVNDDYIQITSKSTSDDFPEAFMVLSDILKNSSFPENEIAKVKESMINSTRANEDSPLSYSFEKLYNSIYHGHPYGAVGEVIIKEIPGITRDELINYYNKYFVPSNMVVSVVGNIPNDVVKRYFEQAWGNQYNEIECLNFPQVSPLTENKIIKSQKDTEAAWISMGWLAPEINKEDYPALKIINIMLGSGLSSKLARNLREAKGMAYSVGSFYPSRKEKSALVFYIGTNPANINTVIEGFDQESKSLMTDLISEEELQDAKKKLTGQYALAHESNAEQAFYLGWYESIGLGYKFDDLYPEVINAVTAQQVKDVANKVFNKPYVLSIVGPKEAIDTVKE